MNKKMILITCTVIVGILGIFLIAFGGDLFSNQLEERTVITVEPGNGTIAIASELKEQRRN